jgi:hypothetical protein
MIESLECRRLMSTTLDVAAEVPVEDTQGPQIVSIRVVGDPTEARGIQITFSEPINPGRARNKDNYLVAGNFLKFTDLDFNLLDDDGDFLEDDKVRRKLPLDEAVYDSSTNTVTLVPEFDFRVSKWMKVVKIRSGEDGIKDLAGNRLDGDKDGLPGGISVNRYKRYYGSKVRYIDADGDKVRLKLSGGGSLYVLQQLNPHKDANSGEATQVWLLGRVKPSSVLTGTAAPTHRGGDSHAHIRELLRTDPAQLDILEDTRFTIDEVSR